MANVYPGILSTEEIKLINDFYESKEVAAQDYWSKNKNLEYHIEEDFSYQLLNPKLNKILGEHNFATGAYKECIQPYPLHVDTYEAHDAVNDITTFATEKKHNRAFLIPLVEGPAYKTVIFDCFSKHNQSNLTEWNREKNSLDLAEFSHERRDISHLPVDVEYSWKLGDIISWDRDQLHISADFTRYNVTKKFLVLFIA